MSELRFFEWDYMRGVVTEYARLGECNGCGDCCKAMIRFHVASDPIDGVARNGSRAVVDPLADESNLACAQRGCVFRHLVAHGACHAMNEHALGAVAWPDDGAVQLQVTCLHVSSPSPRSARS